MPWRKLHHFPWAKPAGKRCSFLSGPGWCPRAGQYKTDFFNVFAGGVFARAGRAPLTTRATDQRTGGGGKRAPPTTRTTDPRTGGRRKRTTHHKGDRPKIRRRRRARALLPQLPPPVTHTGWVWKFGRCTCLRLSLVVEQQVVRVAAAEAGGVREQWSDGARQNNLSKTGPARFRNASEKTSRPSLYA